MSAGVFAAVLLAALLHAGWNALVKGGADKHAAMTAVVLGHLPVAALVLAFVPPPDPASYPWLAGGIVIHLAYQSLLVAGYRAGDLTQVYPIARGVAPLIVAAVSVWAMGVTLSEGELVAIGLIACGILSLALVRRTDGGRNPRAVALALGTGACIAAYSLVDGTGARIAGTALGFWSWAAIGNAAAFVAMTAAVRPAAIRALRDRRTALLGLAGGTASYVAYAIVVWAFTQAPIALVTALRETSIAFALLIGVGLMGEKLDLRKVASTALALTGAVLLRLARP